MNIHDVQAVPATRHRPCSLWPRGPWRIPSLARPWAATRAIHGCPVRDRLAC